MSVNPLYKLPAFLKIGLFLCGLALFRAIVRAFDALARQEPMSNLLTWLDLRFYLFVWLVLTVIFYLAWAVLRLAEPKNSPRPPRAESNDER